MDTDSGTPRHPIRVVAHRTGLTPATIRAWERRYDAVEPTRSEGGQRLYTDLDIERLNTLRALTEMGRSISSVADMPPHAATALLSEDLEAVPTTGAMDVTGASWVDDAFRHMVAMDTLALERTLWRAFLSLGARAFLGEVAVPWLSKVGSAWAAGQVSAAQEHFGSGVLERVLNWMNDPSMSAEDGPTVVVTTLPGEYHALGARLAAAAAQVEGWRTIYLGPNLPVEETAAAVKRVGAQMVAISAVRTGEDDATAQSLATLRSLLDPAVAVVVGGSGARSLKGRGLPRGVRVFESLDAFADLRADGYSD